MNLDGMVLLVRSEVDACERAGGSTRTSKKHSATSAAVGATAKASARSESDLFVLAEKLEGLLLSPSRGGQGKVEVILRFGYNPDEPRSSSGQWGKTCNIRLDCCCAQILFIKNDFYSKFIPNGFVT